MKRYTGCYHLMGPVTTIMLCRSKERA